MAKKRDKKYGETKKAKMSKSDRMVAKLTRALLRGLATAKINNHTFADLEGALASIQRLAMIKRQDTTAAITTLERQRVTMANHIENTAEMKRDQSKLYFALMAQGSMWSKIEGAVHSAKCVCTNEDELARGPWTFEGQALAADDMPLTHG